MKTRKINPRRVELIKMSQAAKAMIDSCDEALDNMEDAPTVNSVIMECFYPAGEYHTFKGWKDMGMKVKKGSTGFAIWGRKRKFTKKSEVEGEKDSQFSAFPMAYLFEADQVEKMVEQ